MNLYRLSINTDDFFEYNNKIVATNISVKDGQVIFYTDKITLKFLKSNNVEYEIIEDKRTQTKNRMMKSRGFLAGMIMFACLLYFNTFRVSRIEFNGQFEINNNIEQRIVKNTKRLFFWDFLSSKLDTIAADLRKEYVEYQWISIEKSGSVVKVVVSDFDTETREIKAEKIGNVVAKKTGIITYCNAYQGKKAVELNQYVKEGDVLISANKLFNTDSSKMELTEARGLVLASTYEEVNMTVYKKVNSTVYTDNVNKSKEISIFGFDFNIGKKKEFSKKDREEKTVFNFFGIFKVKKVTEYEKCDIIKTYNKDSSIEHVKTLIEEDFNLNKTSKLEEIIKMEVLYLEELNDSFNIKMLVKKQESIGIFQTLS